MPFRFPDPSRSRSDIVAIGDVLEPDVLVSAYRVGIFPWPIDGVPLPWFCPRRRAVLDFGDLRISRSLRREQRRTTLQFTIDHAFDRVIEACAAIPRPDQDGTWITPQIAEAFKRLHQLGIAHSVEAWRGDALVGGLYGVDAGGSFGGESMFHTEPNASKLALLYLVEHLRSRGLDWIDVQVLTPHMEAMGARLIPRSVFLQRLASTQLLGLDLFGPVGTLATQGR